MLKRFRAHQENFLHFFLQAAEQLSEVTSEFQVMLNDLANASLYAARIAHIEQQSDKITQSAFELLHKTFITPFDRHHIHQITSILDDLIDHINHTARQVVAYQLAEVPSEIHQLASLANECAASIKLTLNQLGNLKKVQAILDSCHKIGALEDDAQDLALSGLVQLFEQQQDYRLLIKIKDIYERCAAFTKKSQDLANIAKTIVLEYA